MHTCVYRQSFARRPDGRIIYKGEDALPVASEQALLVADGMGGAAAIRHQLFDRGLFDAGRLPDVLFRGVYDDWSDEGFRSYVVRSFDEFLTTADCYFDNIYNIKKSGYFGSRIVSAIMMHQLAYRGELVERCRTFFREQAQGRMAEAARREVCAVLGERCTDIVRRELHRIAENANLVYESPYAGMALLGTTLCAALINEQDGYVDVLYFTSGDSRPYLWNVEGLYQVTADQERGDGGMSNYICANDGASFYIRCEYRRFRKPCILFNASDGCFDSGYFVSPMAFEKCILDAIVQTSSPEELGTKLEEVFGEYGRHDDSSTMAIAMFGFRDYADLQRRAQKRLQNICTRYLRAFPDLLEHSYIAEWDNCNEALSSRLRPLKNAIWENDRVRRKYEDRAAGGHETAHELKELDAELARCADETAKLQVRLAGFAVNAVHEGETKTLDLTPEQSSELAELLHALRTVMLHAAERRQARDKLLSDGARRCYEEQWQRYGAGTPELLKKMGMLSEEDLARCRQAYPVEVPAEYAQMKRMADRQRNLLSIYEAEYSRFIVGGAQ